MSSGMRNAEEQAVWHSIARSGYGIGQQNAAAEKIASGERVWIQKK